MPTAFFDGATALLRSVAPGLCSLHGAQVMLLFSLCLWYLMYLYSWHKPTQYRVYAMIDSVIDSVTGAARGIRWAWWYAVQAVGYHVFHCVRTTDGFWMRYDRDFADSGRYLNFKGNRWLTTLPTDLMCKQLKVIDCPLLKVLPDKLRVHRDFYLEGCHGPDTLPGFIVCGELCIRGCLGITALPVGMLVEGNIDLRGSWGIHTLPQDLRVRTFLGGPEGFRITHRDVTKAREALSRVSMRQLSVMALSPDSTWLESAVAKGRLDVLSYNDC